MLSEVAMTATALVPQPSSLSVRQTGYTLFEGDGSIADGWPSQENWKSFKQSFSANQEVMRSSCSANGWGEDNSEQEISDIRDAIRAAADETGVDDRFILAILMQESNGCVRVKTTDNGVQNPGLMQSHNGEATCEGVNPCPKHVIKEMIHQGTAGTSTGEGLKQVLDTTSGVVGGMNERAFYAAARKYNSGSVDYTNLNYAFISTACYATDVANRVTGWASGGSGCNL
jgi:hypothetical protein